MAVWSGRTEQRIDYRAPVRVIPDGETRGILGRTVNLSPGGVLVDTPEACEIGSTLLCDVHLPGGSRTLRGRVARLQPLSPFNMGVGIAFVDLSPTDAAELRSLVDEHRGRGRSVLLRFEGTPHPVRSRARLTEDGVQLSTPLPFLRLDSSVDVALGREDGRDASPSRGVVHRVALEPPGPDDHGVPRLRIDVRFSDRAAGEAGGQGAAPADGDSVPAPRELEETLLIRDEDRTPPPAAPVQWEWRRAAALVALGLVLGAAALAVVWWLAAPRPRPVAARPGASLDVAAPVAGIAPPRPAPAPHIEPLAPRAADSPAEPPKGVLRSMVTGAGGLWTAEIPITGSLAEARQYPLKDPEGVAVNLPQARTSVPPGTYHPRGPVFREIWVRPLAGGGLHLRFLTGRGVTPPPAVRIEADAVRVSAPAPPDAVN